jgi:hypothetical protein
MDQAVLAKLFRATRTCLAVIKAIMPPRDPGIRSWRAYRARFVEPRRIAAGHRFMQAHAAKLAAGRSALRRARKSSPPSSASKPSTAGIRGASALCRIDHAGLRLSAARRPVPPRARGTAAAGTRGKTQSPGLPRILCRRPGPAAIPAVVATAPWRRFRWRRPHRSGGQRRRCNRQRRQFSRRHGWEKDAPIAVAVTVGGDGVKRWSMKASCRSAATRMDRRSTPSKSRRWRHGDFRHW